MLMNFDWCKFFFTFVLLTRLATPKDINYVTIPLLKFTPCLHVFLSPIFHLPTLPTFQRCYLVSGESSLFYSWLTSTREKQNPKTKEDIFDAKSIEKQIM